MLGYRLGVPDAVDALGFTDRIGRARQALRRGAAPTAGRLLDAAFGPWRGPPYGEFQAIGVGAAEVQRLQPDYSRSGVT